MIVEQRTRSILPPCPIHVVWGSRKTSWDGQDNKKEDLNSKSFSPETEGTLSSRLSNLFLHLHLRKNGFHFSTVEVEGESSTPIEGVNRFRLEIFNSGKSCFPNTLCSFNGWQMGEKSEQAIIAFLVSLSVSIRGNDRSFIDYCELVKPKRGVLYRGQCEQMPRLII